MRFTRAFIDTIAYELPPIVVTSASIEERLAPAYQALRIQRGQLLALTGIRERRYWEPGQTMADGAIRAGRRALAASRIDPRDIGILIYGGVCRDHLEPATACAVANGLCIGGDAQVYDLSNACLGVINGIFNIAGAIELGQVRAGMVVSCESARQIVDITIERLNREPTMDNFRLSLATMTGGSGAIAVVVTGGDLSRDGHRLLGGVLRADPKYHELCRWGPDTGIPATSPQVMRTDGAGVLQYGVALGLNTWHDFRREMGWSRDAAIAQRAPCGEPAAPGGETAARGASAKTPLPGREGLGEGGYPAVAPGPINRDRTGAAPDGPDKIICHQVGAPHRDTVLAAIGMPPERDFSTFEYLGNIGTVSLPITAAIADERGFLERGDRVGFLGIGSGLNCLMLGVEW